MSETGTLLFESKISRRYTAFGLMFVLVLSCVGIVISAQSFRDRMQQIRVAESDNVGWLIAQLDVDHKALNLAADNILLMAALQEFADQASDLTHVHLTFDIFFSRVGTVLASLQRSGVPATLLEQLEDLVAVRSRLAQQIDTVEDEDIAAIAEFSKEVRNSAALIRDVTTSGLQFYVSEAGRARKIEQELLTRFWIQSLVLLVLMLISAILAMRLWFEQEDRALRMRRASGIVAKAFEAPLGAVVIADLDGRILMTNATAGKIFGVNPDEMAGRTIEEVMIPPRLRAAHQKGMRKHRLTGHRKIIDAGSTRLVAMRPCGEEFAAEVSITSDTDLDGRPILIGFIRDISEVVAAEEKLRSARDEAERHASAKTMFLATMSHEMRTPLHGLIASLDLLDLVALNQENQSLIHTARDCSLRALQQVNDVLEITRLGESQLGETPFHPVGLAEDIVSELIPLARKRGTIVDFVIDGEGKDRLCFGLATMFSRALYNLAGNAVKFTENGKIVIVLRFTQISPEKVHLHVEVRDSGIGIAAADQERIFDDFEMIDPNRTRDSGTGLGLPIARIAVQRMGGTLLLESTPLQGSIFCFEIVLPFASETVESSHLALSDRRPAANAPPARAFDVLVVDDNKINATLLAKMVERIGHNPRLAMNGLEAVDLSLAQSFDVILMDVSMPIMDGREATQKIRAGGKSTNALIIGVTAFNDSLRSADLCCIGMDTVLTKPASQTDIVLALENFAGRIAKEDAEVEYNYSKIRGEQKLPSIEIEKHVQSGLRQLETDVNAATDALTEMVGCDSAIRFLNETLAEIDTLLEQIRAEPEINDIVADALHKTVGSTAIVGFSQLSSLLLSAENAARSKDQDAFYVLLSKISIHLKDVGECLAARLVPPQQS